MSTETENQSAARALAFGQFAVVGLGVVGVRLLLGIGDRPAGPPFLSSLSLFLGSYGAWLILVPLLYSAVAWSLLHHGGAASVVNRIGAGLLVVLVLVFAVPLFFHFL